MLRIRSIRIYNKYKLTKKPLLKDQIFSFNKQKGKYINAIFQTHT